MGFIAAICTTCASLPQVIKIFKTRDTRSLSLGMYILNTLGTALWFIHGLMINDLSVIIANVLTCALCGTILCFKIKDTIKERKK